MNFYVLGPHDVLGVEAYDHIISTRYPNIDDSPCSLRERHTRSLLTLHMNDPVTCNRAQSLCHIYELVAFTRDHLTDTSRVLFYSYSDPSRGAAMCAIAIAQLYGITIEAASQVKFRYRPNPTLLELYAMSFEKKRV